MAPTDRYVSETTFHVRYAETDKMGIVHHATYIVWFEEGRSDFIRKREGSYAAIENTGYYLAAGELNARYIKAAIYDQKVTVRCWVEDYKSRTMTFGCEIVSTEDDDLLFKATLKLFCINHENQVTRIPEDWRRWLA